MLFELIALPGKDSGTGGRGRNEPAEIVLRLVRREDFICRSSRPTVLRPTAIPSRWRCLAILSVVFRVHFSPLIGSPAVSLSISL